MLNNKLKLEENTQKYEEFSIINLYFYYYQILILNPLYRKNWIRFDEESIYKNEDYMELLNRPTFIKSSLVLPAYYNP